MSKTHCLLIVMENGNKKKRLFYYLLYINMCLWLLLKSFNLCYTNKYNLTIIKAVFVVLG